MADVNGDIYGFFWDSENSDRKYNAGSFEMWLKKFFTSGVFYGDCEVTANNDMTVSSAEGYSNVDGKVRLFASEETLVVETAHPTYDRIDTVVIERNDTNREIIRKVVKGGYSSEPEPTAPVRANGIYQLVLAEIYVAAGATSITQSVITDKRADTDVCGFVTCPVDTFDFEVFATQFEAYLAEFKANSAANFALWERTQKTDFEAWEAAQKDDYDIWEAAAETAFNTWFQGIQDVLDSDTAGHLLNLINMTRDEILEGTQGKTTVYNGNVVTETWVDGHQKVTTYNGNTVVSQVYDGNNVLQWTKTTTYNGNTIQEVYS